mgnify:CR=1 FL=1
MRTLIAGGLAAIVAIAAGGQAFAETASLRALLSDGYVIRSTNVINADVIQRAVNNAKWVDDYLMTLQRGNQIAFCHVALGATLDAATFVDQATCSYSAEPPLAGSAGPVPLTPMPAGAAPQGSGTSK